MSKDLNICSVGSAIAASDLFIANLIGKLGSTNYTVEQVRKAILPFYSIQWTRHITTVIGRDRALRMFARVRLSSLPKGEFTDFYRLMRIGTNDSSVLSPFSLEEWRPIIIRFNLDNDLPLPEWISPLLFRKERLVETPKELAEFSAEGVRSMAIDFVNPDAILMLWQATRLRGDRVNKHAINSKLAFRPGSSAQAIRCKDIADSSFSRLRAQNIADLEMGPEFEDAGPAAKIRALARSVVGKGQLERFLDSGVTVNVLRQAPDSLDSVASGISCYIAYCDLVGIDYFPPTSYHLRRGSSIFKVGGTFGLYVSHLKKACQILNVPILRHDELLSSVIRGLNHAKEQSDFDNVVSIGAVRQLVVHEGIQSELSILCFLSFLFLLRVPSEGLCMRRATIDMDLVTRERLPFRSIFGIVDEEVCPKLVLKLRKRKNSKAGMVLVRPCSCGGTVINPRGYCPVHRFWPIIIQFTRTGEFIFPKYRKSNINRIPRAAYAKISIDQVNRFAAKCFRLGCSNAMKDSDSTLGQIMRADGWGAAGYRSYLLLQKDEEKFISALIRSLDIDSSDGEGVDGDSDHLRVFATRWVKFSLLTLHRWV